MPDPERERRIATYLRAVELLAPAARKVHDTAILTWIIRELTVIQPPGAGRIPEQGFESVE